MHSTYVQICLSTIHKLHDNNGEKLFIFITTCWEFSTLKIAFWMHTLRGCTWRWHCRNFPIINAYVASWQESIYLSIYFMLSVCGLSCFLFTDLNYNHPKITCQIWFDFRWEQRWHIFIIASEINFINKINCGISMKRKPIVIILSINAVTLRFKCLAVIAGFA